MHAASSVIGTDGCWLVKSTFRSVTCPLFRIRSCVSSLAYSLLESDALHYHSSVTCEPSNQGLYSSLYGLLCDFMQFCREGKVAVPTQFRVCHLKHLLYTEKPALQGLAKVTRLPYRGQMRKTEFQYGVGFPGDSYDANGKYLVLFGVLYDNIRPKMHP